MSEAGPLTRSRSRSRAAGQAEPDAANSDGSNHLEKLSYEVEVPRQRGDIGRRLYSDEIMIGLALGSPGHNPMPPQPADDRDVDDAPDNFSLPRYPSSQMGYVCQVGADGPALTRKGSKWKTLGGLFGKKKTVARAPKASPFYQLDGPSQQGPANQLIPQDHLETNALRRKRADSARTIQGKRGRAGTLQSTTKFEVGGLLRRNSSRRKGFRRKNTDADELLPEMRVLHSALSAHAAVEDQQPLMTNLLPPGPSLLQVQIPNVELERYSVMFGDVLQGKVQAKPQPSLLSRRQGHPKELQGPDKLNTESLADHLPKPRRDDDARSSKSSGRAPSFSLFPATSPTSARNITSKPLSKPSPLSRSVTAPDTTLSPPRPTIRTSKSQGSDHVFVIVQSPEETSIHERKPSSNATSTSANSSQASFFDCTENSGYSLADKTPPRFATQPIPREAYPTRKSSMKKLPLTPSPRHHQARDSMNTAAEVSIAREISISRRQRQLLVPIVPKVVQQPMQPTLIGEQSTDVSRNSTYPTIEDA